MSGRGASVIVVRANKRRLRNEKPLSRTVLKYSFCSCSTPPFFYVITAFLTPKIGGKEQILITAAAFFRVFEIVNRRNMTPLLSLFAIITLAYAVTVPKPSTDDYVQFSARNTGWFMRDGSSMLTMSCYYMVYGSTLTMSEMTVGVTIVPKEDEYSKWR